MGKEGRDSRRESRIRGKENTDTRSDPSMEDGGPQENPGGAADKLNPWSGALRNS